MIDVAEAEAIDAQFSPEGTLRVHSTAGFGQHYAAPLIARYCKQYPNVSISLTLAQRMPNLIEEGCDVSIVVTPMLSDVGLVSRLLGTTQTILCASPAYLAQRGMPLDVEDLANHACLQLHVPGQPSEEWLLNGPDGEIGLRLRSTTFHVNMADTLAVAIREGMGIGPLHVAAASPHLRDGSLVRVLPEFHLQKLNIYALYASRQYLDAKIRTFVDFLHERVPAMLAELEGALTV